MGLSRLSGSESGQENIDKCIDMKYFDIVSGRLFKPIDFPLCLLLHVCSWLGSLL